MRAGSCTVCSHPQRAEIDAAAVGGATVRDLAKRFDRNKDTIAKHVSQHIPSLTQKALEARDVEAGDSILAEVEKLKADARRLQVKAENKRDVRSALMAIDRLTRLVELQARLIGELRDRDVNITNVQIDADTATKMAEMFLARRSKPAIPTGCRPAAAESTLVKSTTCDQVSESRPSSEGSSE